MRVLVCGGRDYNDRQHVHSTLDALAASDGPIMEIIHGDANGADRLAGAWARIRGVRETRVPANWAAYGRGAGPKRNEEMLKMSPDIVVAFPGGRGTAHMVRIAKAANVSVMEIAHA